MDVAKQELKEVVGDLSEDKSRILLKFAEWLRDREEHQTEKELAILLKGEKQIRRGDFVWWRDVKRTKV